MDTACRLDRAVLGVNIQFIEKKGIVIYTLGVIELKKRHTAQYLKEEVEKMLEDFSIRKNQVYSITTDNGRNMLKAVKHFSCNEPESEDSSNENDDDSYNCYKDLAERIYQKLENVSSIKCAAYTLQLAVKDFLATTCKEIIIIIQSRQIVKSLRTPKFR